MKSHPAYKPHYDTSHALVIGINSYKNFSDLNHAVNDAQAIRDILVEDFKFDEGNVRLLLDSDATRDAIMNEFLSYADSESIGIDDKFLFFFAGHGRTVETNKGDAGYLVPFDGTEENLASLIAWHDLVRSSDIIRAKHILFIIDACYGGLVLMRGTRYSSRRFVKDMMRRYSRQAIAAGKADEPVSDADGPIAGHSIFTGNLIRGLEDTNLRSKGVLTAQNLMHYVYQNVSNAPDSQQTPHYGHIEGDGDFIFDAPILEDLENEERFDDDVMVAVQGAVVSTDGDSIDFETEALVDTVKELIPADSQRIKLHDLAIGELNDFKANESLENFSMFEAVDSETAQHRLETYERLSERIFSIAILLAHWGTSNHHALLNKLVREICNMDESAAGSEAWLKLRFYPAFNMVYASGIAALASNNYVAFSNMLNCPISTKNNGNSSLINVLARNDFQFNYFDLFKLLPEHDRYHVPRSEYMFKRLQPILENLIFLGSSYEQLYDRFEILYSLECTHLKMKEEHRVWTPLGRFAWKQKRGFGAGPLGELHQEAVGMQNEWPPLKAGMFNSSIEHFEEVYSRFVTHLNAIPFH